MKATKFVKQTGLASMRQAAFTVVGANKNGTRLRIALHREGLTSLIEMSVSEWETLQRSASCAIQAARQRQSVWRTRQDMRCGYGKQEGSVPAGTNSKGLHEIDGITWVDFGNLQIRWVDVVSNPDMFEAVP